MTEIETDDEEYRPRLTFNCTEKQFLKLQEIIPWGLKKLIFQNVAQDVIEGIEKFGTVFIKAALDRKLRYGIHKEDKAVTSREKTTNKKEVKK